MKREPDWAHKVGPFSRKCGSRVTITNLSDRGNRVRVAYCTCPGGAAFGARHGRLCLVHPRNKIVPQFETRGSSDSVSQR